MAGASHGHQWHLVETAHRRTVAGPAGALRPVADLCGSAVSLAARWDLGPHPGARADQVGCGRRGGLGGQHRQHNGTCPPACEWRPSSAKPGRRKKGVQHPADEGLGRSRGGLTTKFHLACDGKGRPLSVVITAGHRHDSTQLEPVLAGIRVPRPGGRGRPRTRPERLIADKGYSYARCRQLLWQRQIPHTIPERRDQRARRATRPGRPLAFDRAIYARRNVVERCINRLKQWRGLATRYEKRAVNYRAMVVLAAIVVWLGT
jgi:transposase